MALSAANVKVGTSGKISVAPFGTALPTTSLASLNAAFKELGYISDAGLTQSIATTTNKIRAWQNGDTVREVQTEHDLIYGFAALETNPAVLAAYYGNYTAGKVELNGIQPGPFSWVFDVIDGDDVIRVVAPYAQITEREDVAYVNADAASYGMKITAYPDPAYAGALASPAKAYEYLFDISGGVSA